MQHLQLLVFFVVIVQFCFGEPPIPGEAGFAVQITGTQSSAWPNIGGGSNFQNSLGGSWTVELWVQPGIIGGTFQPILSHSQAGKTYNQFADFNLQIWPSGELCFFMGNGESTNGGYGILIFGTSASQQLQENTWYHIAVVFNGPNVSPFTPESVSIYVDGLPYGSSEWDQSSPNGSVQGIRQFSNNYFQIGRFDNQDPGVQFLQGGSVDEVSFWNYSKTSLEILDSYQYSPSTSDPGIIAYYELDQSLVDSTGSFDGVVGTSSEAGAQTALTYIVSDLVIGSQVEVSNGASVVIALDGTSYTNSPLIYFINQLPYNGNLYLLSNSGSVGPTISPTNIAGALPSNKVLYIPNSGYVGPDSFTYNVFDVFLSTSSASVAITVTQGTSNSSEQTGGCDGYGSVYDACGVCNGDGTTCTCIADQYRNYTLSELDRILVHYNIGYTIDLIETLNSTLDQTLDALYNSTSGIDLGSAIDVIQTFNSQCLGDFVSTMDEFLGQLTTN